MTGFPDWHTVNAALLDAEAWFRDNVLALNNLFQLIAIAAAFLAAIYVAPKLQAGIQWLLQRPALPPRAKTIGETLSVLSLPFTWLVLQWLSLEIADGLDWQHALIKITVSLLAAWIVIRVASGLVRDPVWSKAITIVIWTIAALNIVNLLDPTVALLDGIAIHFGQVRISALTVIKGMLSLAALLWLATAASRLLEHRIQALPHLTPSVQVLFSKLLKIVLFTVAVVVALSGVGIDLTAFAVFSGAIGVGIGFGLQKVVSNLISGVILLIDKSVKPGDVIAVGDSYGWINSLGARYVSVITRDGTEHLIPNEELIVNRVENWSFSNNLVRLRIPVGIAYTADLHKALALCVEAAEASDRVLKLPKPVCLVIGFGDSSVDLELRIWIRDPQNGVANVKSGVLLKIWELFHANNIEIPFPQRDLHWRGDGPLRVAIEPGEPMPAARPDRSKSAGLKVVDDKREDD